MINYSGKRLSLSADSKSPVLSRFPAFGAINQLNFQKPTTSERPQCGADTQSFLRAVYNKGTQTKKGQVNVLQSGRSMIEMLGVLAIIGVLSVGGIAGYSKAMTKFKINKTIEQISHIVANTRTLYASQPNYGDITTAIIKKAKLVPDDMWETGNSDNIVNAFGGKVKIGSEGKNTSGDKKAFVVTYFDIPEDACIELGTQDWGAATGSGLIAVHVGHSENALRDGGNSFEMIAANCSGTSSGYDVIACPNGSSVSIPMPVAAAAEVCNCTGTECRFSVKYY